MADQRRHRADRRDADGARLWSAEIPV